MKGEKFHLAGIGGVGMAALAVLLKNRGAEVDGCDLKATVRTRWLESLGIKVAIGHDPRHIRRGETIVFTPAVAKDNPEYLAAAESGNRVVRRGELLAEIVSGTKDSIAVCGTHGKTTTATLIARILIALGEKVEWAIGGETGDFPVGGGDGGVLVVEADESDGTLALYHPGTLVVTNCEYDHPDHFPTEADYFACYEAAKRNSKKIIEGNGRTNEEIAIAVVESRGYSRAQIESVLPAILAERPDRRFQKLEEGVYTDYGHHPSEIRYALAQARRICHGTLRVLFQPHRYSRTAAFLKEFAESLKAADEVILCPVYSAFENPVPNGSSADLYKECRELGLNVRLAHSCEEAWTHAKRSYKDGDLIMIQGAGDIIDKLNVIPPRKIWIGAETNTVRTDLDLPIEYVKSDSPAGISGIRHPLFPTLFPWMAGIPGTLGGWVKMNAGPTGHSISEVIEAVKADGEWISKEECGFGYRTSKIEGEIQDVRWRKLDSGAPPPGALDEYVVSPRSDSCNLVSYYLGKRVKFPPYTKGSVFKNPEGDFAGRLLEETGCKGLKVGGAYVWEGHANVIVAPPDEATASDFLALSQIMRNRVFFRFGIELEPEVRGL